MWCGIIGYFPHYLGRTGEGVNAHLCVSSEGAEESETAAATALLYARLLVRLRIRLRRLRIGLLARVLVSTPPSCRAGNGGLRGVTRSEGWQLTRGAEEPRRRGFEAEGRPAGLGGTGTASAGFRGASVRAPARGWLGERGRGAVAEAR
jgi:hypothetical protein